ncbi:hypothetical protein D3C80_2231450 [compost metagenome]
MDKRVLAYRDDLASDVSRMRCAIQGELGLQRLRGDQPDGQALRLQPAQYRAGENEG